MRQFAMISPADRRRRDISAGDTRENRAAWRLAAAACFAAAAAAHIAALSALASSGRDAVLVPAELSLVFEAAAVEPEAALPEARETPPVPPPEAVIPAHAAEEPPAPAEAAFTEAPAEALPVPAVAVDGGEAAEGTPGATATGEAAPSAAPAGKRLMTEAEYLALVMGLLERHKIYPLSVRKRGIEGDVTVAFTINGDGGVSDIRLADPAGHRFLAQAAFETVRSAAPFPLPVIDGGDGFYAARVRIRYRIVEER